jgi:hypothetical protein
MGQTMWIFGTREVNIGSLWDKLWDKQVDFLGQEKLKLGHNKTKYGTKQDDILGQEKLVLNHVMICFGTKQGVFLGQEKSILSHNKTNYGIWHDLLGQEKLILGHNKMNCTTKQGHFLGYWKVIKVQIRRWSYGRFQDDNNIFHKMKNDLTTGTWQDNIWCPVNIILFCTSDVNQDSWLHEWPNKYHWSSI